MKKGFWILAAVWLAAAAGYGEEAAEFDPGAMVQPVPMENRFSQPGFHVWGGSPLRTADGRYHLYFSRWPMSSRFMPGWATHSEIAYATADRDQGPYRFVNVALPARGVNPATGKKYWDGDVTHNPCIVQKDGKFYLFYMGNYGDGTYTVHRNNQRIGVAVAEKPEGPWVRFDQPIVDVSADPTAFDSLLTSNPAATVRPDGKILLIYKAAEYSKEKVMGGVVRHGAAIADKPEGPYTKVPGHIFESTGDDGKEWMLAEDPFIWYSHRYGERYWGIVRDAAGRFTGDKEGLALFESVDGLNWKPAAHPKFLGGRFVWEDGTRSARRVERPALLFEDEVPVLFFGATDGYEPEGRLSINVQMPLRAKSRPYRIMAVGDSITEGGKTFEVYRYPLWKKLTAAGYRVEFVGSRQTDSPDGPMRHEGYGGKNAEYLAGVIGENFRNHPADIVLLHAGHNHFAEENPVAGIVAATEAMIREVRRMNPRVIVLVAQVIGSGKLPKYAYIPELNTALAVLAERMNSASQPVLLVNQAQGFDWNTDAIEDKVHPNAQGAEKMAERWFEALERVMQKGGPTD